MEDTSLTDEVCTKQNCVVSAGSYLYVFGEPPETRKYVVKAERYDTVKCEMGGNRGHARRKRRRFW